MRRGGGASRRVASVLFCPFCRESFEGETACPEHELTLVPWSALPRPSRRDDESLTWWSPALGRGPLGAGAVGTLLAFMTAQLASTEGAVRMGGSMLKLAMLGSPKLWLVAMGPLASLAILYRRRTPLELRRARLAALIAALVPPAAAYWAYDTARIATAQLAAREGSAIHLRVDIGGYAVAACAVLCVIGALQLGGKPPRST
jgi:hypothetical protein